MANRIIKDVNLLESYNKKPKSIEHKKSSAPFIAVPVVLFLIVGALSAFFVGRIIITANDINKLSGYIAQNQSDYKQSQKLFDEISATSRTFNELNTQYMLMQAGVKTDKNFFNKVYACNNDKTFISGITFYKDKQTFSLTLETSDATEVNQFVKRLIATDLFSSTYYTGYGQGETGKYLFVVDSVLKPQK